MATWILNTGGVTERCAINIFTKTRHQNILVACVAPHTLARHGNKRTPLPRAHVTMQQRIHEKRRLRAGIGWWERTAFCFYNDSHYWRCHHPRLLSVSFDDDRCMRAQVGAAERAKILIWYFVSYRKPLIILYGKSLRWQETILRSAQEILAWWRQNIQHS